eukprot:symbB.v1.2.007227.t1/scaffold441.1/size205278/14
MASADFWFNEHRLPELRADGTWKKKGVESEGNQSYNEVKVKANVLEIVEVNQTNENFCVIFTLVFTYVDPTLRSTYLNTAYLDKGEVKKELAQVWGTSSCVGKPHGTGLDLHEHGGSQVRKTG